MAKKPPAKGDLVKVTWADIQEDPVGNPDVARPAERITYGLFWAHELRGTIDCLVTTTTIDKDGPTQQGYCCYPWGCVLDIEVVKRAK